MNDKLAVLYARAKWILLGVLTIGVAIIAFAVKGLFSHEDSKGADRYKLPEPPKPLQDAMNKADEQALVVKAKATAVSEEAQKHVATVMKIEDGKQRRAALADWLRQQ